MTAPVFLGYDRAALDAEYDNRAKIRDFERLRDRADEAAKRARAELPGRLDVAFVARGLRTSRAVVALINDALMPTVTMAELVRQCRAAVGWLYRTAASVGGDPARITVSGNSAGGHLAVMLASSITWELTDPDTRLARAILAQIAGGWRKEAVR